MNVDEVVRELRKLLPHDVIVGVVLYGSFLVGDQDELSDYDILLVVRSAEWKRMTGRIGNRECDVLVAGETKLKEYLERRMISNNQGVLAALASGSVLYGVDDLLTRLQGQARRVLALGPVAPVAGELYKIRNAAIQSSSFLRKCTVRGAHSPVWLNVATLRYGTFLSQYTEAYCRLHRLWSNAFWIIFRDQRTEYKQLRDLVAGVVYAVTVPGREKALHDFAMVLVEHADELLRGCSQG